MNEIHEEQVELLQSGTNINHEVLFYQNTGWRQVWWNLHMLQPYVIVRLKQQWQWFCWWCAHLHT